MSVLKIKHIVIYPIKSLGPVSVKEAQVCPSGLALDRNYVLVNAQGAFLSQRSHPQMSQFYVQIKGQRLDLEYRPKGKTFSLALGPAQGPWLSFKLWDDTVQARAVSEEADAWFTDCLEEPVRLLRMQEAQPRQVPSAYQTTYSQQSSLADALPLSLIGDGSLRAQEALYGPYDPLRFRANIMVEDCPAFEEDQWKQVRIGQSEWVFAKRCARCQLINVDPSTGKVDTAFAKHLSQHRKQDQKVYMGILLMPLGPGSMSVGDEIQIIESHATRL